MKRYKGFVYDTGLIAAANLLNNLKSILLVPLITKLLIPSDYGAWTQIKVTIAFIVPFLTLGAGQAITKFLAGERDKNIVRNDLLSCSFVILFLSFILMSLFFIFSSKISYWLFNSADYATLTKIIAILLPLEAINALFFEYFRTFRFIKLYFKVLFLETVAELIFISYAIFNGYGILGAVLALLVVKLFFVFVRAAKVYGILGFTIPKFYNTKKYFFFGIPLVISSSLFFILNWGNRYFINYFLGLSQVGIFSVGYFLAYTIVLVDTPIGYMLFPAISSAINKSEKSEAIVYVKYSLKYFLIFGILIFFALSFFGKELLMLFSTKSFSEAQYCLPLLSLGIVIFQAGVIGEYVNIVFNQNMFILYVYLLLAIVNTGLNILFIPRFGIVGAALATLVSFTIYGLLNLIFCQRFITVSIKLLVLFKIIFSALISNLSMYALQVKILHTNILVVLFLDVALYLLLLYISGCFTINEIILFKSLFSKKRESDEEV